MKTGTIGALTAITVACLQLPRAATAAVVAPITLRNTHGTLATLPNPKARATVLIFIDHECPVSNGYAPEISRLASEYKLQNVDFDLIYAEPNFTNKQAVAHAKAFDYTIQSFTQSWRKLVRKTGAKITPEAVVLSPTGTVLYDGRIDDQFARIGIKRDRASLHDLQNALGNILANKPVAVPRTKAVGCYIMLNN